MRVWREKEREVNSKVTTCDEVESSHHQRTKNPYWTLFSIYIFCCCEICNKITKEKSWPIRRNKFVGVCVHAPYWEWLCIIWMDASGNFPTFACQNNEYFSIGLLRSD